MTPQSGPDSFEAVMLPHLDAAYNLARWLVRDPDAARDVVQESMMRALTYFSRFKGINARAWLLQIVRNAAYATARLNRGPQLVSITDFEDAQDGAALPAALHDPADDPERALIREQERRSVDALLESLPVELRETLVLRELEEFSYKEIAQITETPIGTVMSRLWRARQLFAASAQAALGKP